MIEPLRHVHGKRRNVAIIAEAIAALARSRFLLGAHAKRLTPLNNASRLLAVGVAASLLPWPACAEPPRGASTIRAASPGAGYDYVIHVQNTYDYRYNPQVRADRLLLARQIVRPFCSKNQIVGEDKFKTEIFAIKPGKPDYVVYVKCLSKPRAAHAE